MGNSGSAMRGGRRARSAAARNGAPTEAASVDSDQPRRINRVSRWFNRVRRRAGTPPPSTPVCPPPTADAVADDVASNDGARANSRSGTLSRALSQHVGESPASTAGSRGGSPFGSLRWPPLDATAMRSTARSVSRLASRASSRSSSPTPSALDEAASRGSPSPSTDGLVARDGRNPQLPSPEALLAHLTEGGNTLQPGVHLFYTGSPVGDHPGALMVLFVSNNGPLQDSSGGWVMYLLTVSTNGEHQNPADTYEELLALQERLGLVSRGASAEAVQALPLTFFRKGESHTETACSICLREYEEGDGIRQLPCDHGFHRDCVDRWLTEQVNNCPLCRTEAAPRRRPMAEVAS